MKNTLRYTLVFTLFSGLLTGAVSAGAALTVVGDLGGESTAPLFEAVNAGPGQTSEGPLLPPPPASLSLSDMLPVSTPEMSPGPVAARPLNLPGMPPVFVLGDDPASRQWLQQHAAGLRRLQATGMIISVRDDSGLNALRQLAPGVAMVPVNGGDLARRLALAHYPVLITATGISQ
ncbi:integrating conjugative element protein [Pantoea cypripedii]|uniref:Conjugal transfer protein n=1 Tax=Pantoea cypripedii TaxID=55209 RepID=A0A1X1EYP2_PANCY|nr:integrating conjugative element protein [Pantoea cypripedii]ORM94895.1 conjugal transfer protein [Pantoea cypripedii]